MSYEIVVESSCDLNLELRKKFNIYEDVVRGNVTFPDGSEFKADLEWENISLNNFYKIVRENVGDVKTAFAGYEEFERVIAPILKNGKDVIMPVLSTGISGTYNGYSQWAEMLLDDYPERKIVVIDSLRYSSAIGLLAILIAKNRDNGMSLEENKQWCLQNRNKIRESGVMDDLRFLAKSGRIAAGKAFFGSLIGVQPVADFTSDGKNQPLGTLKGDTAVNQFSLDYMLKFAENLDDQVVFITHSLREERAQKFKEQLLKVAHPKEIIITHVGQTCGPSIGPGLCTYFYVGSELSPNRETEINYFNDWKNK